MNHPSDPNAAGVPDSDDTGDTTDSTDTPDGPEPTTLNAGSVLAYVPYAVYLIAAVALMGSLWVDPAGRMLADNYQDQVFFEWVLTHAANAVAHLDNPLFTEKLNAPYGVNLMANTSVLTLAIPLAPVTLLGGAHLTFVLIETLALAGTAAAWYFVLAKLLNHRVAAAVGGAFCGFAPAAISQAAGHPNIAGQYVLPFVVLILTRLGAPGRRPVRDGLLLAALVIVQVFLNEELLFLTALAWGIFLLAYAATRPGDLRPRVPGALKSLGTTALAASTLLAYPLAFQFIGPSSYRGLPDFILGYSTDLASYWSFARRSLVGNAETVATLAQGATEENTFFGWPLLILLVAVIIRLRRDRVVWALTVTGLVFATMSLGPEINMNGRSTGYGGPWGFVNHLPLFDSVVPTRLALVVTPIIGCLLARAVAMVRTTPAGRARRLTAPLGAALLVAALVPLVPTPLPTQERPFVPVFFTGGAYRDHIPRDGIAMGIPPGWSPALHHMQWQTGADLGFRIYGGYFFAPSPGAPTRVARFGASYPDRIMQLDQVAQHNNALVLTAADREVWLAELRGIRVTTILMPAHHWAAKALRDTMAQIAGPGTLVEGVWVWQLP